MIPQSDLAAWVRARIGHLTASNMETVVKLVKDGPKPKEGEQKYKYSAGREAHMFEVLAERFEDGALDHYVSQAMQDGLDREPIAFRLYEAESGDLLLPAAFVEHETIEFFGATPDAFVPPKRTIQFKCPTLKTYIDWVRAGVVPEEHKAQMTAEIACARRYFPETDHAMFVAYHPSMPEHLRLFIRRFEPTAEQIAHIECEACAFLSIVDRMFDELNSRKAA